MRNFLNKYINKYTIIILSFYIFWLFIIPFIFAEILPVICENISYNSGYKIEIINPHLKQSFLPSAKIQADKIHIQEKDSNDFVTVEKFDMQFRLLPLLSGKLHINEISAEDITLNTSLKEKVVLDKDFFKDLQNTGIKCDKIRLNNFKTAIYQQGIQMPVLYSGDNVFYQKNGRFIKLQYNSRLNIQNSESETHINLYLPRNNDIRKSVINVKIENFDLAPLGTYLKQYLPKDVEKLQGIVNVDVDKHKLNAVFNNCAVIMKDNAKSVIFPKILNIDSDFIITAKVINFENVNIKSQNINAAVNGSIFNYLDTPVTKMDLNVQLNQSKVEDIVNALPPIIVEEFNVYKLKKYKFYGDVIGNFSVKGNTKEPEITGDIFIDNGILIEPIKNARGATIKLNFAGKYLNFDVVVPAGGLEKVWVKGGVELYNVKYSDMRIWSTPKVDLELAEKKVLPLHEILNFVIGPVPIMDVKGDGNIDITVKGNRKNPHVWGVLNFNNVHTYFIEMPDIVLQNAQAILRFNDENAFFKTQKGVLNGKNIDIQGNCTLSGKFDFNVKSENQEIGKLYKAIKTSTMIDDLKNMLPELDLCEGLSNVAVRVYGEVKYIEDLKFNKNFFTSGKIELLGNKFGIEGININSTKGTINFDGLNAGADITSNIGTSPINAKADIKNDYTDVTFNLPRLNMNDIIKDKNNDIGNVYLKAEGSYKGKLSKIEYDKVNFTAKILGSAPQNKLKVRRGEIVLKNNKLNISDLSGNIIDAQSLFNINLEANNITERPNVNGNINLKGFELSNINTLANCPIIPEDIRKYLNLVSFDKGRINLNGRIDKSKVTFYTDLGGIAFTYEPLKLPVKIINGSLIMRNNNLRLNKINMLADGMPFLADGIINDVFSKQYFNMYFNSKPKQEFIDKYINKNQIYPVKVKGDIVYSAEIKGGKDNFNLKADVNMAKDSSIYHLGATVGDVENAIVLNLDTKVINQNILKIKEFSYDKIIPSLGSKQTRLNMLKAYGGIEVFKDDLLFHDLYIKTQNPTDARIFNIIFRKPNIKQGQFTSDLRFNGRLSTPKLLGTFHIFETNIPFLDTTMKNINFNFKERTVELSSKGEILGNDITIKAVLKNKLTIPYQVETAVLNTKLLDLNYITDRLKLSQVDNFQTFESFEGFDLSSLIINDLKMNADSIHLRNIVAENFEASASFNENKIINVDNFKFNLANGTLNGSFTYNLNDNNAGIKLKAKDMNANELSYALFDLNNQLYGDLTGDIKLSCTGTDFDNCMKTLNGKTKFTVSDGRMPKLGSLEYLLKAGNLIKGGLTGISINSIIDIVTPLKTGDFSDISGNIVIKDGIADNIEITTKGKDLSLFIGGTYNFATAHAEMNVLGLLSKKISTMFGPIGNLSLNTLFNAIPGVDLSKDTKLLEQINRIPGIELSEKTYRKFIAEIKGNINGDDYVTSFKWIN